MKPQGPQVHQSMSGALVAKEVQGDGMVHVPQGPLPAEVLS